MPPRPQTDEIFEALGRLSVAHGQLEVRLSLIVGLLIEQPKFSRTGVRPLAELMLNIARLRATPMPHTIVEELAAVAEAALSVNQKRNAFMHAFVAGTGDERFLLIGLRPKGGRHPVLGPPGPIADQMKVVSARASKLALELVRELGEELITDSDDAQ